MTNRHREAALAAVAIHSNIRDLSQDCFARNDGDSAPAGNALASSLPKHEAKNFQFSGTLAVTA